MFFNKKEEIVDDTETKIIDNLKALNIDIINTKHNGNYDITLSLTKAIYTLYTKHLRIDPKNPNWLNRDRIVLSSFSAYSLLLSILYMSGYDITLDSLKTGDKCFDIRPGIDMITDTFAEGIASATGMAIGEKYLEEYFKNTNLFNYYTYVIATDLDIIKGTSFESLTCASSLKLNKLIILFDNNKNVLNNNENDIFNIDIVKYFESLNLNTIVVDKNNLIEIDNAITKAKTLDKPTVIVLNHDNVHDRFENNYIENDLELSDKKITDVKTELGVRDIPFTITSESVNSVQEMINNRMVKEIESWNKLYDSISDDVKTTLENIKNNNFILDDSEINYEIDENDTLDIVCYKVLNCLSKNNPFFIGGTSNFNDISSKLVEYKDFTHSNYLGKNINYGLRENAIASIQTGIGLTGIKNFSITSIRTVSKLISSIRIASIYNVPSIYIIIEDENTIVDGLFTMYNQDILALRNIDDLEVFRPNDANEVIGVFKYISEKNTGPVCIFINKNITSIKENSSITDVVKGAYIIRKEEKLMNGIIISTGADLDLSLEVSSILSEKGYDMRVISMPSLDLYLESSDKYKEELIPMGTKVFIIEKSSSFSWYQFVYNDKYLITPDKVKWYNNLSERDSFRDEIVEKIENLLK